MDVRATRAARAQFSYDQQTRFNERGDVQHLHSAKRNLAQVGIDVVDAVNPVNNLQAAGRAIADMVNSGTFAALIGIMVAGPLMGLALLAELLEIALLPLRVAKDASDVVYHVAAAGVNGRPEGSAQPLREGEEGWWPTQPSLALREPAGTPGVSVSRR